MSQFSDVYNNHEVECPYCGYAYQAEGEDYSEDERSEECENCGKKYYHSDSFTVTHETRPDCKLNGMEHDYQLVDLGNGARHPFCTVCGDCQ